MNMMSEDAKTILMLCGHLGGDSEFEPLNQREYNQVVRWLLGKNLRPSDLLSAEHIPSVAAESGLPEQRLNGLLKRGVKLGFAVEKWNQSGIWVICRSDPDYPVRYKIHLKEKAPPILFGAGERELLKGGGLAIVGSRDVDAEGESFARKVAERCAHGEIPVVSGGARGVDQIAMASALEAGGVVIGVLADTLLRRSVSREVRYALSDRRLLLLSPYHPEAGFNVGTAMGRNKLIYALADYGLVVSAEHKKGGTWEGAIEELKRKPGRPVFVRLGDSVPMGNRKLIELGALEFPCFTGSQDPTALLQEAASGRAVTEANYEAPLFSQVVGAVRETAAVGEHEAVVTQTAEVKPVHVPEPASVPTPNAVAIVASVLEAVKPLIIHALDKPRKLEDLAKALDVRKPQLQDWVKELLKEGVLKEQVIRKVKKLMLRKPEEELKL